MLRLLPFLWCLPEGGAMSKMSATTHGQLKEQKKRQQKGSDKK